MTALRISRLDQRFDDTQKDPVEPGSDSPQATSASTPSGVAPAGPTSPEPTKRTTMPMQAPSVRGTTPGSSQIENDTHGASAAAGSDLPADHGQDDAQRNPVGGDTTWNGSAATNGDTSPSPNPSLADPFLALAADVLDDTEANREANENRLRQMTRTEPDKDGQERGFGLSIEHPTVAQLAALVQMMKCDSKVLTNNLGMPKPKKERGKPCCFEHTAEANLARLVRQHPLGPWIKAQRGVGDKQAARLLAIIGDPYTNAQTGRPRTVSQLWSYCGHGDPNRKRRKGMTQADLFALGNPKAKNRTWLIACAILMAQGPLSAIYYDRKAVTEGRTHATDCRRCGPSGHPALAGSPLSKAHRNADALRITGKEFLRLLWLEAKRIHRETNPDL